MDPIPDKVGRFKIETLLDKGGMSYLYLATDPFSGESVALKVLQEKFLHRQEVIDRFLHECALLKELEHPGIVRAIDSGVWDGGYYLALEFVQGISLKKWIHETPLSLPKALDVILQIAQALCHLHTHGIIHRDLKPENLLLSEEGRVKLIDLGIARRIDEEEWAGESNRFIGTPSYMSPEQRVNPFDVSFPADIYSLGIIAYELILGRLSHGHVHLSLMPKGFQKILFKALQPLPKDRYRDLVDFITDLIDYQTKVLESPSKEGLSPLYLALEGLESGLEDLSPKSPPQLEGMEAIWSNQRGVIPTPFAFDLLPLPKGFFLFFGESGSFGPRGIVEVALLRGMEKGVEGTLEEKIIKLKRLVESDTNSPLYKVAFLEVKDGFFNFISFGTPTLIKFQKGGGIKTYGGEAPALGVVSPKDPPLIRGEWNREEILFFDPTGLLPSLIDRLPPYQGENIKWLSLLENRFKSLFPSRLEGKSSFLILFTYSV